MQLEKQEGQGYPELTDTDLEGLVNEQPPTPPETGETPPEPEVELDGEKIPLSQVREYKKGYLRQSDYTKKSQEIAAQRKEIESLVQLAKFLDANPPIAKGMIEYLNSLKQQGKGTEKKSPIEERLEKMESMLTQTQEASEDKALDAEIAGLKKQYPDFNEDAVLEAAEKWEIPDLEAVYLKLNRGNLEKTLKTKLEKEATETAKRKIPVEGSAMGGIKTSPKKNVSELTYEEIADSVINEI
jgi:hypothetical protein